MRLYPGFRPPRAVPGKGRAVSDAKPPFTQATVMLNGCRLVRGLSSTEASGIGELLSGIDPWLTLGYSASALAGYLMRDDPGLHRFLVRIEDMPAGVMAIRHPWLRGPYIELLGLAPDIQGIGLGRELLRWAEAEAAAVAGNVWVAVSDSNTRARSFYEKAGFLPVGRLEGLVREGMDEWLLRKRLSCD